jgi:hypothetical protein
MKKSFFIVSGILIIILLILFLVSLFLPQNNSIWFFNRNNEIQDELISESNFFSESFDGLWRLSESNQWWGSTLKIFDVNSDSFSFEIDAFRGCHEGGFSGIAKIKKNQAFFKDETNNASVIFTLENDILILDGENLSSYGGTKVIYTGEYKKNFGFKKITFTDREMMSESQEEEFKNITGEDYELFLDSYYYNKDDSHIDLHWFEDLDGFFDAKIFIGDFQCFYTPQEAIIIIFPEKKFVALIPSGDKVNYYTNIEKYKNNMPKTIEKWFKIYSKDLDYMENFKKETSDN